MSCRTTYVGSALTSVARLRAERSLTDVQVLSAYHVLRSEGRGEQPPAPEAWNAFLDQQQASIRDDEALTQARRASLINRLTQAREQMPDGRTWYAVNRIERRVRDQATAMDNSLNLIAHSLSITPEQARERLTEHMNSVDRSRTADVPEGYSDAAVANMRANRLPEDPGTVSAMHRLLVEARQQAAADALAGPQRIEHQPLPRSGTLATAGYDPDGGRLEVTFRRGTDQSRVYAYRNVSPEVWEEISTGSAGVAYNRHVRNNPGVRYASQEDADLDSAARRCTDCGQFVASSHACPVRAERARATTEAARAAQVPVQPAPPSEPPTESDETSPTATPPAQVSPERQALLDQREARRLERLEERRAARLTERRQEAAQVALAEAAAADLEVQAAATAWRTALAELRGVPVETLSQDESEWQMDYVERSRMYAHRVRHINALNAQSVAGPRAERLAQIAAGTRPEPARPRCRNQWRRASTFASLNSINSDDQAYRDRLTLGSVRELRAQAAEGPVAIPVSYAGSRYYRAGRDNPYDMPTGHFNVTGTTTIDRLDRSTWSIQQDLRCECAQYREYYDCAHLNMVERNMHAVLIPNADVGPRTRWEPDPVLFAQRQAERAESERIAEEVRLRAEIERAQQMVEQARQADWTNNEQHVQAARARHTEQSEVSYEQDFGVFERDYQAALNRRAAGQEPVEYMTDNATNGLCSPDSGRGFGVEMEFDIPDGTNRGAALAAIGRELHAAGLTQSPHQQRYHAAASAGYTTEHQGGWSFEADCTVSGEIVSPVMYDTPETWENVAKVCDIIKRNGGTASARTGSHVHVGTGSFGTDPAKHTELLRSVQAHEDVMYRISANPDTGTHRPMQWCAPNRDIPPTGYSTVQQASGAHNSHGLGVNMQSVQGRSSDHVEMRHWDGSLNPSVIQAQVKISAALVAAAERNASAVPDLRPREFMGSHQIRNKVLLGESRRNLTSEELAEDSKTFRSFADTLFTRAADKAQVASLFAITKWAKAVR